MRSTGAYILALALVVSNLDPAAVRGQDALENRFVYAQLRYEGDWDPYPQVWGPISAFLKQMTSVTSVESRRVVSAADPALFDSPFLLVSGRGFVKLSERELFNMRNYLAGGGFLLVDNSEAEKNSAFARSILPQVAKLFPGSAWEPLASNHAVFRSFFLLKSAAGRRVVEPALLGLKVQDRVVAVYCANDIQGAWARDPLGNPLYTCEPGGELQRAESHKLMVNLVVFSLTGTYKTDAIHQPFLERKLSQ
jgi:hypothetical protein